AQRRRHGAAPVVGAAAPGGGRHGQERGEPRGDAHRRGRGARAEGSRVILVTGATGFLGRHIVAALAASARAEARAARPGSEAQPSDLERRADASARTMTVRALVRQPVRGLAAEQVVGDVRARAALGAGARGPRAVTRAAGLVSRAPADAGRLMRLHVDGTRNVLQAAADAARIVVVSSSGTIAVSNDPDRVAT